MAKAGYANLVPNTTTFANMLDRLNSVSTDMGSSVVTFSPDGNNGDVTVNGSFQAQTFIVAGTMRGGNTTTPNTIQITTNVNVSANVSANVGIFNVVTSNTGNVVSFSSENANITSISIGNGFSAANGTSFIGGRVANTTTPAINVSSNSLQTTITITANTHRTVIGSNGTWAVVSNTGANLFSFSSNNFTFSTNVSLKTTREVVSTVAISSNTLTLDLSSAGVFEVSLNSAITSIVLNNLPPSGELVTWQMRFRHSNNTSFPITWPSRFKWAGNSAPTFTFAANTISTCLFQTTEASNTSGIISAFFSGST